MILEDEMNRRAETERILKYVKEKPKYAEILKAAVEHEERNRDKEWYLGWEWFDVRASSSAIKSLVLAGIVDVKFKSKSSTHYRLHDIGAVKDALDTLETETLMEGIEEGIEIPDDMFDIIVGYEGIKELVLKSLKSEKPTHFLFVGKESTAKSLFLTELSRLRGAEYILGGSSTKVGILDILLEHEPDLLLIDELDKCDRKNLSVLLSLCQDGVVKQVKHGIIREVKLDTRVFCACNTTNGLPPELLSRFSRLRFREYSDQEAREVMTATLIRREGVEKGLAEYIADTVISELGSKDPRDAMRMGRLAKDKNDVDRLIDILKEYR